MASNALSIVIDVEAKAAKSQLKDVDQGVAKIGETAKSVNQTLSAYDKQVQTVVQSKQALATATSTATDSLNTTREALALNSVAVQDLFQWVNEGGQGWSAYGQMVKEAWTILRSISFADIRAGLNLIAEGFGITVTNLGLMASAGLVVATAMASWKFGEWLGDITGLTKAVGAWESATNDLALAQQTSMAKMDVVRKAIEMGAPLWINYGDAVTFVNAQFAHLHDQSSNVVSAFAAFEKSLDNALAKKQQAKELGDFIRGLPGSVAGDVTDLQADMAADKAREDAQKRLQAELDRSAIAQAKYRAEVTRTVTADADQVDVLRSLLPGLVQGTELYTRVRDAIGGMLAKGLQVPDMLKHWYDANKPVLEVSKDFSGVLTALPGLISETQDSLHNLASTTNEFHDGITSTGQQVSTVIIPLFSTLGQNVVPQMTKQIKAASDTSSDAMKDFGRELGTLSSDFSHLATISGGTFGGILKDVGQLITTMKIGTDSARIFANAYNAKDENGNPARDKMGMVIGAAGMAGSFSAATAANSDQGTGAGMAKGAASGALSGLSTGAAIGTMILPGIGTAVGAAVGAIAGGIVGFARNLGASAAEKAGRQVESDFEKQFGGFNQMMAAVGKAYEATGRSATMAQADVKALMDAEKQGADATTAAMNKIKDAFAEQQQDAIDLTAAVQRYGFTIEQLGPAMQKQNLDAMALQVLNDWRLLVGAGIDVVTVDQKMASTTWDYLQMAKRTGQEVPEAMKPILQSMIDQGVFTDESGAKLTELSQLGVTFSETMTQGFDKVVTKLQELLDKIGLVPAALSAIPDEKTVHIGFSYDEPHDAAFASRGGYVTNGGVQYLAGGGRVLPFRARGSDTVPAMLTPGEGVVNRAGMKRLGKSGLSALNGGGGGGGITVSIGDISIGDNLSPGEAGDKIGKIIAREMRKRGRRIA